MYVGAPHFTFNIPELGQRIAESIVRDYLNATFAADPDAHPALFSLPGKLTKEQIKKDHAAKLTEARDKQLEWMKNLCRHADDQFARFRTHNVITRFQRIAAEITGYDAAWVPKFTKV